MSGLPADVTNRGPGCVCAEVGDAVERSESAVRQAAHRAHEHIRARRPRFETDRVKKREATERFFAAVTGGDINELMELLAPEVTLWTDGGGRVRQAMRPILGVANVARWIAGTIKRPYEGVEIADMAAEIVDINGGPGIVMSGGGRVIATFIVDLDADGRIVAVHNVADPAARGGRRGQTHLNQRVVLTSEWQVRTGSAADLDLVGPLWVAVHHPAAARVLRRRGRWLWAGTRSGH